MALMDRVHSDGAILPGLNYIFLMTRMFGSLPCSFQNDLLHSDVVVSYCSILKKCIHSLHYAHILFYNIWRITEHQRVVSELFKAYHLVFSLFWSIWEYLEESVWLFRVNEVLRCDFQIILHFVIYFISHCI